MKKLFLCGLMWAVSVPALWAQTYWQQEVNYEIEVSLDDKSHTLRGFETFEYTNNSPEDLSFIYMHLWPNAFKDNKTAFAKQKVYGGDTKFFFADKDQRGYIDSLAFTSNGEALKLEYDPENPDIAKLFLNKPLKKGEKTLIQTPFRVRVPDSFSRLGHVGTSYQITQWYPKPAVYDQSGWHPMPNLDRGEFYSEFGKFDVKITLPANYVVGATGDLQTQSELQWLDGLAKQGLEKSVFPKEEGFPESAAQTKTLHYTQDRVHDFAWFADKRFNVLKGEMELPGSKRKVTTWAMFTNSQGVLWKDAIEYLNQSLHYYSLWNGDYPYNVATAVEGALSAGAGMEYPTITIIGNSSSPKSLDVVIAHEIGHNWFYGILGSNERDYPWMDEGVNSYNEVRYTAVRYPDGKFMDGNLTKWLKKKLGYEGFPQHADKEQGYLLSASRNQDQPCQTHSDKYSDMNYFGMVYAKTPLAMRYLADYLGQEKFDEIMKAYFERWKFKHPQPADFRKIFEEISKKDLSWFFDGLIESTKKMDYKAVSLKDIGGKSVLSLKNKGGIAGPVPVKVFNGKTDKVIWVEPFNGKAEVAVDKITEGAYALIDPAGTLPEMKRSNNLAGGKGYKNPNKALSLEFLFNADRPETKEIIWLPVLGYNTTDKLMPGLAVHNYDILQKKVEYYAAGMYGTGQKNFLWQAGIDFNFLGNKKIGTTKLSFNSKRFGYFMKNEAVLRLNCKSDNPAYKPKTWIELSVPHIVAGIGLEGSQEENRFFPTLAAGFANKHAVNGLEGKASVQYGAVPGKEFGLAESELTYKRLLSKKNSFRARLYAAAFLKENTDVRHQIGVGGNQDYAYQSVFLDRAGNSEILAAGFRQNNLRQGAMRSGGNTMTTGQYLLALNTDIDIPKTPLKAFFDFGYSPTTEGRYGTGLQLDLMKGFFSLYIPVASSDYANGTPKNGQELLDNLRFSLRFDWIQKPGAVIEKLLLK